MLTLAQKTWTIEFLATEHSIDAMDCTRNYRAQYGERVDWHPFASYLDELLHKGIATFADRGRDGFTRYRLNHFNQTERKDNA